MDPIILRSGSGGGGGGPPAAFGPADLFLSSEKGVWFDPSDFSTMFQDAAGTTPVTAAGQPIGKILDKSGNLAHATQSTASYRPILQQDGGGRYYIYFDGVDDGLSTPSIDLSGTSNVSLFVGARKLSDALIQLPVEFGPNAQSTNGTFSIMAPRWAGTESWSTRVRGSALNSRQHLTYAAPITNVLAIGMTTIASDSDAAETCRINTIDNVGTSLDTAVSTGNFSSQQLHIGYRFGGTLNFNGWIYSLILRGSVSSPTEIADAESWVNTKTGAY